MILEKLANFLESQNKLLEAEKIQLHILEIAEKEYGFKDSRIVNYLEKLTVILKNQGKLAEAQKTQQRAEEIKKKSDSQESFMTPKDLADSIAPAVEGLCHNLLEMQEKTDGLDHINSVSAMNCVAAILKDKGNLKEAEKLYRRILSIREQANGVDSLDTAST